MLAFRRSSLGDEAVLEAIDISDRDLRAFYTGALAFLFPSREEGFGWPILEAQACGCPVVTTNRGPMKEIAGDAAVLIDPGEPAEAAEKVARALANRDQLRAMGFRNAARFTVDRAIDAYVEVYANAIVRKPERVGVQGSL
jgi:glycosyltransferase involved in cell wall biosynthesis